MDTRHSPFSGRVPFGYCYALGLASFQASYSSTNYLYGLVRLLYRTEGRRKRPCPLAGVLDAVDAINKELRIYTGFINDTGKELPTIIAFEDILEIGVNMT